MTVAAGRSGARVRVSNFPGERPILRGRLWIGNPSYWTIRGLNVTWADGDPDQALVRIYRRHGLDLHRLGDLGRASTAASRSMTGPLEQPRPLGGHRQLHPRHVPTNGANQDQNIYVADMRASPHPQGLIAHNVLFNAVNGRGIKLGPEATPAAPSTSASASTRSTTARRT